MTKGHGKARSRGEEFVLRAATRIWEEVATSENPYIAGSCRCHGYDLHELMEKRSFVDVLYLLFQGELPTPEKAQLLERLMIALINPGPRHPATRAAMCAGVGKTESVHILPISLSILGGEYLGAHGIAETMKFLRKERDNAPEVVADSVFAKLPANTIGDVQVVPGFGSYFGGRDSFTGEIANQLLTLPGAGKSLCWANRFVKALFPRHLGWLPPGLAAAVFVDLGFHPSCGPGLFQLISAPGLYAHGIELANKPITALPFVSDDNYVIERDGK